MARTLPVAADTVMLFANDEKATRTSIATRSGRLMETVGFPGVAMVTVDDT